MWELSVDVDMNTSYLEQQIFQVCSWPKLKFLLPGKEDYSNDVGLPLTTDLSPSTKNYLSGF